MQIQSDNWLTFFFFLKIFSIFKKHRLMWHSEWVIYSQNNLVDIFKLSIPCMLGPGDRMTDKPSQNLQMIIEYVDRESEKEQRKLTSPGESEENSLRKGGEGWNRAFWVEKTAFTNTVREQQA